MDFEVPATEPSITIVCCFLGGVLGVLSSEMHFDASCRIPLCRRLTLFGVQLPIQLPIQLSIQLPIHVLCAAAVVNRILLAMLPSNRLTTSPSSCLHDTNVRTEVSWK